MKTHRKPLVIAAALALSAMPVRFAVAESPYNPAINPANFLSEVNNPYFTLRPGATYTYKSHGKNGIEFNKVIVTNQTRKVMGVTVRVVLDRVWLNDRLIEETYDWYAQDKEGNVLYFGEDSKAYRKGRPVSTEGSWEAGVDGAKPGIVMQAQPRPGVAYRQEYKAGQAEDMGQVVSLGRASPLRPEPTGTA